MQIGGGEDAAKLPGAGAAGGLAYGLVHYLGGSLAPGFDLVSTITGLSEAIKEVDIVITGEGSLDKQTLSGKGPYGVSQLAREHGKKVYAVAGVIDPVVKTIFDDSASLSETDYTLEECMSNAPSIITEVVIDLLNRQ